MAGKILVEHMDSKWMNCDCHMSFGDPERLLSYYADQNSKGANARLKIHIPGSIYLSQEACDKITALGVINL